MESGTRPVLTLIDGSAYIFRAYHAIRAELSTSTGIPTRAVYGFTRMLLKSLREASPTHVAVVWDRDGRAVRHQLDPEYKAHREETPDDLKAQFPYIRQVVEALEVPSVEKEGWEADDVIATLTRRAVEEGFDVVIVTGDKDFSQLVGPHVRLYDGMLDRWTGPAEVEERWGVPPELFVEVQSLVGDTSDNIPGVPGVGKKTAADLVRKYGRLEEVIAACERGEVKSKRIAEAILAAKERLALNRDLVRLRDDLELERGPADLARRTPDVGRVQNLFRELEFYALLRELPAVLRQVGVPYVQPASREPVQAAEFQIPPVEIVVEPEEFGRLLSRVRGAERLGLRLAPPEERVHLASPPGVALAFPGEASAYVPLGHQGLFERGAADPDAWLRELVKAVGERPWSGIQTKRDLLLVLARGLSIPGPAGDAELAAYLLNPARRTFDIVDLAREKLGAELREYAEIAGAGRDRRPFALLDAEVGGTWLAQTAACALAVEERLRPELEQAGLDRIYRELEIPLVPILARMEHVGVKLDPSRLEALGQEVDARLAEVLEACHRVAGREVNVASPRQLAQLLFEELKLPVIKRTKTGPSTDHEVLEKLAEQHPLPKLILEHRMLAKLKGTYIDTLPQLVSEDGRLRTTFEQAGTATGRLSSSNPNLMNIPIRTELGRRIRKAFVAEEGYLLLTADYSQIEMRVLAHVTGDPGLIRALREGADIHRRTASEIFDVKETEVTPEQRGVAKMVNYAVAYGLSAYGLSTRLDITPREAADIIARYFERYAGVKAWIDRIVEEARQKGYVTTLEGRRRFLPDLRSRNPNLRQAAERAAINMPIQGTAADIMKRAMIRVDQALSAARSGARLLLQVHDELVLEVPQGEVEKVSHIVREGMEGAAHLDVPLVAEINVGETWEK